MNDDGPDNTYLQWFDTSVFSAPAANTFGNMTRNMGDVRGPRFTNLDFSLVKQFTWAAAGWASSAWTSGTCRTRFT